MESMNENINIAPQESKLVIYLVVAAKVIVYMLLMFSGGNFPGGLGAAEELGPPSDYRLGFIPERAG